MGVAAVDGAVVEVAAVGVEVVAVEGSVNPDSRSMQPERHIMILEVRDDESR